MQRIATAAALMGAAIVSADSELIGHNSPLKHITDKTFQGVIAPAKTLTVSLVLYYDSNNPGPSKSLIEPFEAFATKYKGWFIMAGVDCSKASKLCKSEGIKEYPAIYAYPMSPMPKFKLEKTTETDIAKTALKYIPNVDIENKPRIGDVADVSAIKALPKQNLSKLKVVWLENDAKKKKPEKLYRALATNSVFARTVDFRWVGAAQEDVHKSAGASAKKKLLMYRGQGKSEWYKGAMDDFAAIYDWINTYQESGMGDSVRGASGAHEEAEMVDDGPVPEFQAATSKECFGQSNMCAIYLSQGPLAQNAIDDVLGWESAFTTKKDRGVKYSWMWMDVNEETDFVKDLKKFESEKASSEGEDFTDLKFPSMLLVKPPKKKREEGKLTFHKVPSWTTLNKDAVSELIEKVDGGSPFSRINMPKFASRKKGERTVKKEEL